MTHLSDPQNHRSVVSPREGRLHGDNRARVGRADARWSLIVIPTLIVYHLNQAEMISQQWGSSIHMVNKASLDLGFA